MKTCIVFCALFVVFVSVNGDPIKDMLDKLKAQYAKMGDADIKKAVSANVKSIQDIMVAATKRNVKEDLTVVNAIYQSAIKFINQGQIRLFADLDKEDAKLKHIDYVQLGVIAEVLKFTSYNEDKKRGANPIKVVDTEENLNKKVKETYNKILDLLKWTITEMKKKKELAAWVTVHQNILNYMAPGLNQITGAVQKLKKESRAKNLQVILADLELTLRVVDTRKPGTFTENVTEKVHEMYSKVKSFFAKLF